MTVLVGLKFFWHLRQRSRFQHVNDKHGMMGCQRAATLRDDIRMRQIVLVGCIYEGIDTVIDVFLNRVVDRRLARRRTRTIIINAKTTSTIDKVDVIAHLMQLDIELRGFTEGRLDAADLCNLRTDMEMD